LRVVVGILDDQYAWLIDNARFHVVPLSSQARIASFSSSQ
jgi:hypothetical protein